MNNLANISNADEIILEELYLAKISSIKVEKSKSEVPYSYIGRVGDWTFKRAWNYWIAHVDENKIGILLKDALILHNNKHPIKDCILGDVIRSGGHAGCPSPDEYGAIPIKLRNKNGKPIVEKHVICYHIDDQIGLNQLASAIRCFCLPLYE